MIYSKAVTKWGKHYTRKDYRAQNLGKSYKAWLHYSSRSRAKPIRREANRVVRQYNSEVSDFGWYKKLGEVWWIVF